LQSEEDCGKCHSHKGEFEKKSKREKSRVKQGRLDTMANPKVTLGALVNKRDT